jgi:hypothetical protein
MKIPGSRSQIPNKFQSPKNSNDGFIVLDIEDWSLFVI